MSVDQAANPWIVRESGQASVPPGFYVAKFVGVEAITNDKFDGPRWRWVWEVVKGEHSGRKADALTQCDITPAKQAGVIIAGLLGGPIVPGQDVEAGIKAAIGKPFMVGVQPGPKGGKAAVRSVGAVPVM